MKEDGSSGRQDGTVEEENGDLRTMRTQMMGMMRENKSSRNKINQLKMESSSESIKTSD